MKKLLTDWTFEKADKAVGIVFVAFMLIVFVSNFQ